MYEHIGIIGSTGGIGNAMKNHLCALYPKARISTFSRSENEDTQDRVHPYVIDYADEKSIEDAVSKASADQPFDFVIVCTGILHDGERVQPEKALKDLSAEKFQAIFFANTIFPALVAKHILPRMNKDKRSVFAALSARVGSISDNQLGGWYAYRASKAALNMVIRNAAIEMARRYKDLVVVGLHPGTVDSNLSKPFQGNVKEGKLFTPDYAAEKLVATLNGLTPQDSGKLFAWNGEEIAP